MTTVIDYAFHAYEAHTGDAEVAHQLFWMDGTKIRILCHLVMLASIFKCQVVFGQFLRFERLLQAGLAKRTEGKALLFYFDETDFAEGVTALQVTRHPTIAIEVFIAGRALHVALILSLN